MAWYFIGVYIRNSRPYWALGEKKFSHVQKYIFSTLKEKFRIPKWPCNILYYNSLASICAK